MKKTMTAITISPTELRSNQKKYFDLAETTRVFVKRGNKVIELVVKTEIDLNPSPSGDPWFADPRNVAEVMRRIEDYESGKSKGIRLDPNKSLWENIL